MAFNPLEYLKEGNVDFIFNSTTYDRNRLIENIRKSPNRIEIINGFYSKLKDELPSFCFYVIYDIKEFADEAYELLDIKRITPEILSNLLYNSPLGLRVLYENFDTFLSVNENTNYFDVIIKYAFDNKNKKLLHKLSRYSDLHVRFLFMCYLIDNHPKMIKEIYNDITEYMTSFTFEPFEQLTFLPELMNQEDVSKLAVKLLNSRHKEDYIKLKKIILEKYKYNSLAYELLTPPYIESPVIKGTTIIDAKKMAIQKAAFEEDPNTLFITSADYRFYILFNHKGKVKQELLDELAYKIRYFINTGREDTYFADQEEWNLKKLDSCGLSRTLEDWTEKYMDLSQSKEYGFVGSGTTCSCYRIGDYVIKLVGSKWSFEDIICPNIYLIAKNFEEIYVRNKNGVVRGGLEVQKYLTRSAKNIDPKYFKYFDEALGNLGYRRTDTLVNGTCGENAMLLDTYYDADCINPESLPKWFKEYPIVIIDRDRIYPKGKENIKQLSSGY